MKKWHEDYLAMRPGTPGGERAAADWQRVIRGGTQPPPKPKPLVELPVIQPQHVPSAVTPGRPPREPWKLTKLDAAIAAVVWLVTALILWRGSYMDGGGAIAVGFFVSGIAARFWRYLLTFGIAALLIWLLFLRHGS